MLVSPPTRHWTSSLQLERGKGARSSRCSSLETMPVGFRSLKKGSHPCSQSRPHCLPARWLRMRKTDSIKALWGEGIWVPNKAKGLGGTSTPEPGCHLEGWPQPGWRQPLEASPPPQVRRHHLLLLLFAYSGTFHRSRRLLARCSRCRHWRATSAYVSLCACAMAQTRPLVELGWPVALARLPIAHALSLRTRDESRQGEPNGARSALLYPLKMA